MSGFRRWVRLLWRSGSAATALAIAAFFGVSAGVAWTVASPVVPWLDRQPARAPANPPLAPVCRASDLHARLFLQGATGSLVGGVELFNAGAHSCALVGRPTVSLTGTAATAERWRVRKLGASSAPPDVLADPMGSLRALRPGKSASVALFWSNWCGPGATPTGASGALPDAITLRLTSATVIAVPVVRAPRCDAPQYPSTLSVGPFVPTPRHLPQSSRLRLRVAIVGTRTVFVKPGLRAFHVHRGERFTYEVAVTNIGARPFRFAESSCPAYIEQFAGAPPRAYVLNCRPVGVIAAGKTVLFDMLLSVPPTARLGNTSLTWQLAPRTYEAPFTPAALWVAP